MMFNKFLFKRCYFRFDKITQLYSRALDTFLNKHPDLLAMKKYIPPEYLKISSKIAKEHLYLICPNAAKKIADHVVGSIQGNQIVAETNAGLGLITNELLERGVERVRMYETCGEFREDLKKFTLVYPGRVELFIKDLFHLSRLAYMDKQDGINRVDSILKNVPKKAWTDDPAMTIIGPMPNTLFIKFLIKSLALQMGPRLYGRMQIFGVLNDRYYQILTATPKQHLKLYQYLTIMFQLLCDYEKLDEFPRNIFLPWERSTKRRKTENETMVLLKINLKKNFTIPMDQILPLFYFVKQFYGSGNNMIIPTVEKWVPGCGINILIPKLSHNDYFKNINIFTKFRELTPPQILAIFKEMIHTPAYVGSPFTAMMENELIKSETIETVLADATVQKKIFRDTESHNYQDEFD